MSGLLQSVVACSSFLLEITKSYVADSIWDGKEDGLLADDETVVEQNLN